MDGKREKNSLPEVSLNEKNMKGHHQRSGRSFGGIFCILLEKVTTFLNFSPTAECYGVFAQYRFRFAQYYFLIIIVVPDFLSSTFEFLSLSQWYIPKNSIYIPKRELSLSSIYE